MPVNYAIPQPTPGTSRATSPKESEILIDVSDTIADVGDRLDTLEAGGGDPTAADVTIADAGAYYTAAHVEGALQEVGADISALEAAGVADGDKGDITVSSGGTVWTIDAGAVDASKVAADVATQAELDAVVAGLSETIDDRVAALLVAGSNVTLTYDDVAGTLTVAAAGGGGGGATNLTWTAATSTVASDTGTDAVITAVDDTNPGLMTVAQKTKLDGIAAGATDDTTVDAHIADTSDAHDASAISYAGGTGMAATDVEAALDELATEKVDKATVPVCIGVALSDETTAITTGTAKVTIRSPFAFTLTSVRASLNTASTSGIPTVDINEAGVSVLSTKLTIDANEKTSTSAATAAVISDSAIADDAELTFDVDVAGTGAKGLKVWLLGTRSV